MNEIRLKRVENLIRDNISTLIMHGEIKDPRVNASVALTEIKLAKDLTSARIRVSSFGGREATRRAVEGLNSAAGFIQSRIGRAIKMRATPRLSFSADHSIREGMAVNRLIDRVMEEQNGDRN